MVEVLCLPLTGVVGKTHGTGAGLDVGACLIEAHLTLFTYADHKEVKVAGDGIELDAVVAYFILRDGAVRDVDVLLQDVNLVQECLMYGVVAALEFVAGSGIILIDCDNLYVLEGNLACLIAACEFIVKGCGSGAGCETKTEKTFLLVLDSILNDVCYSVGRRT